MMAQPTKSLSSSNNNNNSRCSLRQPRPLPCELLIELLLCLPRKPCRLSALLSTSSSVVCNLMLHNKSLRRWRQQQSIEKQKLVQRAMFAKLANNHVEMAEAMKQVVHLGVGVTHDECGLLHEAYGNIVKAHEVEISKYLVIEKMAVGSEKEIVKELREKCMAKLLCICKELLGFLDECVSPSAEDKVFFRIEKANYHHLVAKLSIGGDRNDALEESKRLYKEAYDIAKPNLHPNHPFHLILAQNTSMLYNDFLNLPHEARFFEERGSASGGTDGQGGSASADGQGGSGSGGPDGHKGHA